MGIVQSQRRVSRARSSRRLTFESLEGRRLLATYYLDALAGDDANAGNSPDQAWASLAKLHKTTLSPGDEVLLRRGAQWDGELRATHDGTADNPITFGAYGTGEHPLLYQLYITGNHTVFEEFTVDHQQQSGRAVRVRGAEGVVLRNMEVRNGTSNGVDIDSADGILIDGLYIHHFLAGSFTNQVDAHGIVATRTQGITIRNTEIHHVSGDSFQADPARDGNDMTTDILIEDSHFWTSPLDSDFGPWRAGERPGENAIDTKVVKEDWENAPRMRLTLRNITAHGWIQDGYINNKAAFNMKENIEATFDGVTVYDSEIAFRLRGDRGNANVTLLNAVIYDVDKAIRAEGNLANLKVYNSTFGDGIGTMLQFAGGDGGKGTWDIRNNAFVGSKPAVASDPSNLIAASGDFVDAVNRDYHLQSSASLIDAGATIAAVTTDRDGVARPEGAGYDVGAFEYVRTVVADSPALRTGMVSSVNNAGWTKVTLDHSYTSMVVVATPNYTRDSVPLVTRIRNADGNSFEVRVDRTDGNTDTVPGIDVHYTVVEEGVYTEAEHGVKMEAVRIESSITDHRRSWGGEQQSYANSYLAPVVIGQVMSYNDPQFSAFWARGSKPKYPPSPTLFFVGKQVGEDPNTTRANETIGYLVIEQGAGSISGRGYVAAVGPKTVQGAVQEAPYQYPLSGLSNASTAALSLAGMAERDGGWAVLYGSNPITDTALNLAVDEDQAGDLERLHTTERVAFLVFDSSTGDGSTSNQPPVLEINHSLELQSGAVATISSSLLQASDAEQSAEELTFSVIAAPQHGTLLSGSTPLAAGATFSQADIDLGLIAYRHDGDAAATNDRFNFTVSDGSGGLVSETAFEISVSVPAVADSPALRTGMVSSVNNAGWTKVTLDHSYTSMVVVATPNYTRDSVPLVTRIRNADGNSFEVRVDRTDGNTDTVPGIDVHYTVVEEGVYTEAEHGVKMEAVRVTSSRTDHKGSWRAEQQSYVNSYSAPVVTGQVMSYNDSRFSAFWARGGRAVDAPSATQLYVGKHVGEDPDNTRADEIIGYLVIETGSGSVSGRGYVAGVGAAAVRGAVQDAPYQYPLSDLSNASTAAVSMAGIRGSDGAWAILYGSNPVTNTALNLAVDEDQAHDAERMHTTERVAFLVFAAGASASSELLVDATVSNIQAFEDTATDTGIHVYHSADALLVDSHPWHREPTSLQGLLQNFDLELAGPEDSRLAVKMVTPWREPRGLASSSSVDAALGLTNATHRLDSVEQLFATTGEDEWWPHQVYNLDQSSGSVAGNGLQGPRLTQALDEILGELHTTQSQTFADISEQLLHQR